MAGDPLIESTAKTLVSTFWIDGSTALPGWSLTASAVDGAGSFDSENAADCSPFTVAQVQEEVGLVRLSVRDGDREEGEVVGGPEFLWMEVDFEILTPQVRDDAQPFAELVRGTLEGHFQDVYLPHDDAPEFTLWHRPQQRSNESKDHDDLEVEQLPDDGFRHNLLRIYLKRQQMPAPVGAQEVPL